MLMSQLRMSTFVYTHVSILDTVPHCAADKQEASSKHSANTPPRDASLFGQGSEALTALISNITDDVRGHREGPVSTAYPERRSCQEAFVLLTLLVRVKRPT